MFFYLILFVLAVLVVGLGWFLIHVYFVFGYSQRILKKKKEEVEINGGTLVAEVMKAHGVEQIFTLCGLHISSILVECKKCGIKVFDVRHEATAAFAADAVSRLTGQTGVAVVTAGPGLTNTLTALKNAQVAQSPMILIAGAAPTLLRGRGSLQDIDQVSIVKSMCKRVVKIDKVSEIVPELKKCFQVANEGVPGPCYIEIPLDLLFPIHTIYDNLTGGGGGKKKKKKDGLVDYVIKYQLFSGFYKGFDNQNYAPLPIASNVHHGRSDVKFVANLLKKSKRPIFVLGSQVVRWRSKLDECVRVLDKFEIPFYCSGKARGLTGIRNPYFFRHGRGKNLRSADVIVLFGVCPDFRLNYGRGLNRKAKIVTVNLSQKELVMNKIFWKAAKRVHSCPQQFLIDLGTEMKDGVSSDQTEEWMSSVKEIEKNEMERIQRVSEEKSDLVNPLDFYLKTDERIQDDDIIIVDGGDFAATCAKIVRPRQACCWLDPGPFGTLGVGAGFSLGAKAVFPDRNVWVFYGDGAFGYSLVEFDTFDRLKMKRMINVIGNDGLWNQVRRYQVNFLGDDVGCNIDQRRGYEKSCSALGSSGFLIKEEKGMEDGMDEVMKEKDENVVVVNLMIANTSFREGSNYI